MYVLSVAFLIFSTAEQTINPFKKGKFLVPTTRNTIAIGETHKIITNKSYRSQIKYQLHFSLLLQLKQALH